jgi:hypothetical protein
MPNLGAKDMGEDDARAPSSDTLRAVGTAEATSPSPDTLRGVETAASVTPFTCPPKGLAARAPAPSADQSKAGARAVDGGGATTWNNKSNDQRSLEHQPR